MRWVLFHMIDELARHAGQGDIIRETIDGATLYELLAGLEDWEPTDLAHARGARPRSARAAPRGRHGRVQSTTGVARRETPQGTVELFYEDLGDPARPSGAVDHGPGCAAADVARRVLRLLVDAGYRVIRFDHRDSGLSAKLHGLKRRRVGLPPGRPLPVRPVEPGALHPGRLADDAQALLDHLGIARAHVVGASMGGMIAQILAATDPDRVATLGVIMSTTGKAFSSPACAAGGQAGLRLARRRRLRRGRSSPSRCATSRSSTGRTICRPKTSSASGCRTSPSARPTPRGCCGSSTPCWAPAACCRYAKAVTAPTVVLHGSQRPDAAGAQRPGGCGGHSRRPVRGDRRNGS